MTRLFRREARFQIADRLFNGLDFEFDVKQSLGPKPNTCRAVFYNLGPTTRSLFEEGALFEIEAGYRDAAETLYVGAMRTAVHQHSGSEWRTVVDTGDGEKATRARVSRSYQAGVDVGSIFQDLAGDMEVAIGNVREAYQSQGVSGALQALSKGEAFEGRAFRAMQRKLNAAGLDLSIQDGQLQAVSATGTTSDQAVQLDASTGLIGTPEAGDKGIVHATSLLQPAIRPGRQVRLVYGFRGRGFDEDGFYRVEKVQHTGATRGTAWYSKMELKPL